MNIALLRPDSSETPLGRLGAWLARALAPGEVESFRMPPTALGEARTLADLCARAGEFDLIHNLVGATPLAFAAFVSAPILSTLPRELSFEELTHLSRFHGKAWFVGGDLEAPPELDCAAVIPTPAADAPQEEIDAAVRAYLAVYAQVTAARARLRADSVHDRRPWGEYWVLADTPTYKVKRLDVLPGKRLSYQRHARRAEHWLVVRGRARVTLDGTEHQLAPGESIDVPLGAAHRLANPGPEPLSIVEVQLGSYFGEDDIERLADDFGR